MISAIVLAAGQSTRMGADKMLLPWGATTVIDNVIATLQEAGVGDIHVVTGGTDLKVRKALSGRDVSYIVNPDYQNGEMLNSIQTGLRSLGENTEAILVVLGDQPHIEVQIIQIICERYLATRHAIIVPSYRMHRGHPWLVSKAYWNEILELKPPLTLNDFLNNHSEEIEYVIVNTPSILQDLDTRKDYLKHKP